MDEMYSETQSKPFLCFVFYNKSIKRTLRYTLIVINVYQVGV